jgi:AcrR family transcriptional regulator
MLFLLDLAIRLGNVYSDNMASNANSVNIESEKRGYHHGDLRSALVQAGLDLLKTRAPDAVSLREIARMAGVSATAVYRHFPDKQALLSALCDEGAEDLARLQQAAMAQAGGGRSGFDAVGRTYVRFALANPTLFRLMMTAPVDACAPPGGAGAGRAGQEDFDGQYRRTCSGRSLSGRAKGVCAQGLVNRSRTGDAYA